MSGGSETQDTVDAYLSGKFELGGRKHDLVVGMSSTRTATRTDGYTSVAGWSYVIPNIYTWDGNAPAPTYSKTGAWRTQITQQTGLFASARWRRCQWESTSRGKARLKASTSRTPAAL